MKSPRRIGTVASELTAGLASEAHHRYQPAGPGRSPLFADAMLAEAVREGWLTPPVLAAAGPPPRKPVMPLRDLIRELQQDRDDRRSISIARSPLRNVLAEDRSPPDDLWRESLASSRLLEYEVWNRVHARRLAHSHGEVARIGKPLGLD